MGIPFEPILDRMMHAGRLKNASAVARALGVTPQALSNYKKRGEMPTDLIVRFAEIQGCSIDWLVKGEPHVVISSVKFFNSNEKAAEALDTLVDNGITDDERDYVYKLIKILRSPFGEIYRFSLAAVVEGLDKERNGFSKTENDHDHVGKEAVHVG